MKYIIPSKKTHLILLVFLFEFFLTFPASYASIKEESAVKRPSKAFWSIGNTTMFPGKVQIDSKGTTELFNFNPTLSFGLEYPFKESPKNMIFDVFWCISLVIYKGKFAIFKSSRMY